MDSNGKFTDTRKLFPGQTVSTSRCSNTARALQLLDRGTLGSPRCIIINTGTNDLCTLQHNTARPRLGQATLPGTPPHHNVSPGHPLQARFLTNSSTVMLQLWAGRVR
ncbi:hypothetical protein SKAU_G00272400 [Synaphobranchus kaupii]|uniref:Uncharacterized protein n=1 Tax=Synaphobranchus kaupii TaxID=118154 RepID=A0A9Q1F0L9_SYNKA|nr:hypothetical protein SKAU_G00272400 [Synaphobranchus kaupii]